MNHSHPSYFSVGNHARVDKIPNVALDRLGKIQLCVMSIYEYKRYLITYSFCSFDTGSTCMGSVDTSVNHRFCGADKCEADHTCTTPCPNGDECPPGENCYDDTPCSSNIAPPSYDFAYCGTSEADALSTCWQPCRNDEDCCFGQTCFSTSNACEAPNFSGSAHFFCGTGELSMTEMIFEIAYCLFCIHFCFHYLTTIILKICVMHRLDVVNHVLLDLMQSVT